MIGYTLLCVAQHGYSQIKNIYFQGISPHVNMALLTTRTFVASLRFAEGFTDALGLFHDGVL